MIAQLQQRIANSGNALAPFLQGYLLGIKSTDDVRAEIKFIARELAMYESWLEEPTTFVEYLDTSCTWPLNFEELERKERALKWLTSELESVL